jgi:hypothetical protein
MDGNRILESKNYIETWEISISLAKAEKAVGILSIAEG